MLRLLATMKSEITAMRALAALGGGALDLAHADPDQEDRAALLIPIIKGWLTERSLGLTSQAVQVHGGMGFIEDTGIAQHYRDARILPIYEGTTAIQANDLVFRKTIRDKGASMTALLDEIAGEASALTGHDDAVVARAAAAMTDAVGDARAAVAHLLATSNDPRRPASGGVNYLMMLGYLTGGWMMLRSASAASRLKGEAGSDVEFMQGKLASVDVYMTHSMPQVAALLKTILGGDSAVLAMQTEWLAR